MNSKLSTVKTIVTFPLIALLAVCGCKKEEQTPTPVAAPGATSSKPAIVSAEKNSFNEVTSKLDPGGNLYVYLSTEKVLTGLSEKLASVSNFLSTMPGVADKGEQIGKMFDFAGSWLKDSGIEQISGLGASSIAREPGFYYSKVIVHHYPGQNEGAIWSVMGKESRPLKELDLLPENTAMTMFTDLDLELIWKDVRRHFEQLDVPAVTDGLNHFSQQFQAKTGLDWEKVLASLGGNYGIILTLDPEKKISLPIPSAPIEIPSPGLALVIKVKSDIIFDRVDELAKNNPMVARVDKPDLKMRTMAVPLPLPVELRPTIARAGDYLILATTDTMIQDMLDVQAGKKKGFKSTAEYAHLSRGIPAEGNNFSIVTQTFINSMMALQSQALTNNGTMSPDQVAALQKTFNGTTNQGSFSVGANGPEGWEGVANGSQSLQSLILPAVAGVAVGAAIAIPAIIKAKKAAHGTAVVQPDHHLKPVVEKRDKPQPAVPPAKVKKLAMAGA